MPEFNSPVTVDGPLALPAGSITSAMIVDGTIVNADVSATAAIAASKIGAIPESQVTNLTTDLAAKATDTAVVHLAGAETIAGVKTITGGTKTSVITSGALPTTTFTSGTGKQISTARDSHLFVPFTLTTAAGTLKVELSPDNTTYSTLATLAPAVNAAVSGVQIQVPASWWVRLTATNATIGTATLW